MVARNALLLSFGLLVAACGSEAQSDSTAAIVAAQSDVGEDADATPGEVGPEDPMQGTSAALPGFDRRAVDQRLVKIIDLPPATDLIATAPMTSSDRLLFWLSDAEESFLLAVAADGATVRVDVGQTQQDELQFSAAAGLAEDVNGVVWAGIRGQLIAIDAEGPRFLAVEGDLGATRSPEVLRLRPDEVGDELFVNDLAALPGGGAVVAVNGSDTLIAVRSDGTVEHYRLPPGSQAETLSVSPSGTVVATLLSADTRRFDEVLVVAEGPAGRSYVQPAADSLVALAADDETLLVAGPGGLKASDSLAGGPQEGLLAVNSTGVVRVDGVELLRGGVVALAGRDAVSVLTPEADGQFRATEILRLGTFDCSTDRWEYGIPVGADATSGTCWVSPLWMTSARDGSLWIGHSGEPAAVYRAVIE